MRLVVASMALVYFSQTVSVARTIEAGDRLLLDFGKAYVNTVDGLGRTWNSDIRISPSTPSKLIS